jgi:O-antigen ligase
MFFLNRLALFTFCLTINFDAWRVLSESAFSLPKLIAFFYFIAVNSTDGFRVDFRPFQKPMLFILATFSCVALGTVTFGFSLGAVKLMSFFLNVVLLFTLLKHSKHDHDSMTWGLLGLTVGIVFCFILLWLGIGREINSEKRVTFFGDNENALGLRACIGAIVLFVFALENRFNYLWLRTIALGAAILTAKLVLDTGSRVSFIALIVALALGFLLFSSRSIWFKLAVIAVVLSVASAVVSFVSTTSVYARMERAVLRGDLAGREKIWVEVWPIFFENPLYGVGYSGLQEFLGKATSPHNVVIEILVIGGVVGFIAYALYCWQIGLAGLRAFKNNRDILPILLLIPMAGTIASGQALDVKLFYFIPAFVLAAGQVNRTSRVLASSNKTRFFSSNNMTFGERLG